MDLDKYIFPLQMCFFGGHLRLVSSCIQVNTVLNLNVENCVVVFQYGKVAAYYSYQTYININWRSVGFLNSSLCCYTSKVHVCVVK